MTILDVSEVWSGLRKTKLNEGKARFVQTRPTLSQIYSFKICPSVNIMKLRAVDRPILKLIFLNGRSGNNLFNEKKCSSDKNENDLIV